MPSVDNDESGDTSGGANSETSEQPNDPVVETQPAPVRVDQFNLARTLKPMQNVQSDFMSFGRHRFVNYHAQVYEGVQDADNTASWVILLKVGLPDTARLYSVEQGKRHKLDGVRKYRRNYTFANVLSNGNVMVFLELNAEDQEKNMSYLDRFRIGDQFVIIEPNPVASLIAQSMPIVKTDFQFIPVALANKGLLPRIEVPDVIGLNTSKFFIIHEAKIVVSGVQVVRANCTMGNMCDFRTPDMKGCCCWRQQGRQLVDNMHVLKVNLTINYKDRMGHMKSLPVVQNWCSKTFTSLVLDNNGNMPMDPLAQNQDQVVVIALRRYIRNLVKYINEEAPVKERGWTVIGWYKRGTLSDSAHNAQADDKVAAAVDKITMHIVRVHPTHLTRNDLQRARKLVPTRIFGVSANYIQLKAENEQAWAAEEALRNATQPSTTVDARCPTPESTTQEDASGGISAEEQQNGEAGVPRSATSGQHVAVGGAHFVTPSRAGTRKEFLSNDQERGEEARATRPVAHTAVTQEGQNLYYESEIDSEDQEREEAGGTPSATRRDATRKRSSAYNESVYGSESELHEPED